MRQKRETLSPECLDELCRELQTALGTAKWQVNYFFFSLSVFLISSFHIFFSSLCLFLSESITDLYIFVSWVSEITTTSNLMFLVSWASKRSLNLLFFTCGLVLSWVSIIVSSPYVASKCSFGFSFYIFSSIKLHLKTLFQFFASNLLSW